MLIWTLLVGLALASTVNAKVHRQLSDPTLKRENSLDNFNYRQFTLPAICGQNEFPDLTPDLKNTPSIWRYSKSHSKSNPRRSPRMADAPEYTRRQLPSLVQILMLNGSETGMCSGVIIHPQIVMTHSLCLDALPDSDLYVLPSTFFSRHPFKDWSQKFQPKFKVEYYCQDMDVAMLVLEKPLEMHVFQRSACVDTRYIPPFDGVALSAGFGMTQFWPTLWTHKPRALKVFRYWRCKLPINDPRTGCYRAHNDATKIHLKPPPQPKGAWCSGDTGGPLLRVNETGHHYVTGIIMGPEEGPEICVPGSSFMNAGHVLHFAYAYNEVIKNWLAADPAAYKTKCFKAVYHGYNPPPIE